MITEKKVSLYEKYSGLIDAYIFENGDIPNHDFSLMDWSTIDQIIGDIILLNSGKASSNLQAELTDRIKRNTENNSVIDHLNRLAKKKNANF